MFHLRMPEISCLSTYIFMQFTRKTKLKENALTKTVFIFVFKPNGALLRSYLSAMLNILPILLSSTLMSLSTSSSFFWSSMQCS